MSTQPSLPWPEITTLTQAFWTSGASGRLVFRCCEDCDHIAHPPTAYCPECLGSRLSDRAVSGHATVVASTVNHHPWHPAFAPPYAIAIVEIEEASCVRLTTRIINCDPEAVHIGMAVSVSFVKQGPAWIPLFEPRAA